jgi:carboxylate-amine ligase
VVRTVGIEEEFLVLDGETASLRPLGEHAARTASERGSGQFEHELKREQAELGSAPHTDLADLHEDLQARRRELQRGCDEWGARIVATGLSPFPAIASPTPDERYERLAEVFGETARIALSCGMHVHVGVDSRTQGVEVLNAIRCWLPVLLALSANSPYLDGRDTAHEGYRTMIWHRWPSAGPFGRFSGEDEYDRTVAGLVGSGAALDDAGLYLDARLSASYPTVEIRVADVCPHVEDAVTLAGLCRALVTTAASGALPADHELSARVEIVRAAMWRAARYGVEGELWHPVRAELVPAWELVDDLVSTLEPDLDDSVRSGLDEIRRRGTGSRLQRGVFDSSGDLAAVVDALADVTCP